jgi:hypothetical protein
MKSDLLKFIVWLVLLIVGAVLTLGREGSVLRLIPWFSIPFVLAFIDMVANGVAFRDLLKRLGIAAPWIIAAVLASALFGLALMGTFGLIFGSMSGVYIGIALFWLWATYPPTKRPQ